MDSTTHMVDVGGHRLRLALSGNGPLDFLCLHGLVDRIEIWDRIVAPLSRRGRVARLDQRGTRRIRGASRSLSARGSRGRRLRR